MKVPRRTIFGAIPALLAAIFARPDDALASACEPTEATPKLHGVKLPNFVGKFSRRLGQWQGYNQPRLLFTEYDLQDGPECICQSGHKIDPRFTAWVNSQVEEWMQSDKGWCMVHVRMLKGHPEEIRIVRIQ